MVGISLIDEEVTTILESTGDVIATLPQVTEHITLEWTSASHLLHVGVVTHHIRT